ncbi:hypothetical protein ACR8AL_08210 [Clavibacter sepedonicus]|nr:MULTISPECIES: hypothetical protein [Clavibacter]MBD5382409.1 hypothetical protein [Clavibacter sp.]OQJ48818.1 hypothetical protein B5P19_11600 [Clavibacter sepedonicus]OQJ54364.1 hypothetical protein B5P20_09785 [Clavibacter sepedonicus]UUK65923.1 hypothetical protein LRE50_01345 [Clavibacter sepedonicus]
MPIHSITRSTSRTAYRASRSPVRWRSAPFLLTLVAIIAVGLTTTGVTPAHAATHQTAPAAAAISPALAASVRAGTTEADIRSGRITVDQLADAAEVTSGAARGLSSEARAAEHAQLVRETASEVAELRLARPGQASTSIPVDADAFGHLVAGTTSSIASDPLVASDSWKSFWHHITHPSITLSISPAAMRLLVAGAGSFDIGALCALTGAVACAFIGAAGSMLITYLMNTPCVYSGMYFVLPYWWNSRCK